jgi:hypothetical protein
MRRVIWVVVSSLGLLAACQSARKPAARDEVTEVERARLCADPQWRADHAGLWYAVCRRNAE